MHMAKDFKLDFMIILLSIMTNLQMVAELMEEQGTNLSKMDWEMVWQNLLDEFVTRSGRSTRHKEMESRLTLIQQRFSNMCMYSLSFLVLISIIIGCSYQIKYTNIGKKK